MKNSKYIGQISSKLKKMFLGDTIQKKLFMSSILLIMIVIITFYFISHWVLSNLIIEKQIEYDINTFKQADNYLRNYFSNIDRYIQKTGSDQQLDTCLTSSFSKTDFTDLYDRISTINKAVEYSFDVDKYVDNIFIIGANNLACQYTWGVQGKYVGDEINFDKYFDKTGIFTEKEMVGKPSYFSDNNATIQYSSSEKVFFNSINNKIIYTKILQNQANVVTGAIVITFNNKLFNYIFSSSPVEQRLYLLGNNKELIWSNQLNNKELKNASEYPKGSDSGYYIKNENSNQLISEYYTLSNYNFQLISEIPISVIMNRDVELKSYTINYSLGCFLFVLLFSYFFSKTLLKPLSELAKNLSEEISFPLKNSVEIVKNPLINVKLRIKILIYFICTVILPGMLFISIITYKHYDIYREKITQSTVNSIKWVKWNIDYSLKIYDGITQQIIFSNSVQELMQNFSDKEIQTRDLANVEKLSNNIKANKKEFLSMSLYNKNGESIYSLGQQNNYSMTGVLKDNLSKMGKSENKITLIQTDNEFNMNPILLFARTIRSIKSVDFGSIEGYLSCSIDKDAFYNLLQKIKPKGTEYAYYLLDAQGNLIVDDSGSYNTQTIGLNNELVELLNSSHGFFTQKTTSEESLIFYDTVNLVGLKIIGVVPSKEIKSKVYPLILYGLIFLVTYLFIIILVSTFISAGITRPLKELRNKMDEVNNGNFKVLMEYKGKDEIAVLSRQFNSMLQRLNELIYENYQSKLRESQSFALQTEAQLNALQQQINPHFLYNTLEAIKWIAYQNGLMQICEMTTALGKFFRGSISQGVDFITFDQEIEHLKNYIYIQKIRYQERLDIHLEIEDAVKKCKTVKLVLQPLVENAINHGIDSLESGGLIIIRGYLKENLVHFEIEDNGVGISPEKLDEIKEKMMERSAKSGQRSIGLSNVYKRLKLRLGEKCNFDIESQESKGTIMKISMPIIIDD